MLCQAEYSNEGYFHVFEVDGDDFAAIVEAESLAEEGDFVFNVFEITDNYEVIRTIL